MTGSYSADAVGAATTRVAYAAIDYQMHLLGWVGSADQGFHGSGWGEWLPPATGPTGTMRLTLGGSGAGGGVGAAAVPPGSHPAGIGTVGVTTVSCYDLDPWASIYEPVITEVRSIFDGWQSLPDPAGFSGPVRSLQAAVVALTPTGVPSGGTESFASVDLTSNLALLARWVGPATAGASQGALVYAFDAAYGSRIQPVMHNQAQVALVLGTALAGEQRIWEKARLDVMNLLAAAEGAFRAALLGTGGVTVDLEVVTAFLGLLESFTPPQVKAVLAVGSAGLDLVQELLPEGDQAPGRPDCPLGGGDPPAILDSIGSAVQELNRAIFDQEAELNTKTLGGMAAVMYAQPAGQFHIHPVEGIDRELTDAGAIDVNTYYLKRIGYETVPTIASFIARAADDAEAADSASIWTRPGTIGFGRRGPYAAWQTVRNLFDSVTTGSARELVDAGKLLAVGAGWLEDSDEYSRKALEGVTAEIGRGRDGWDGSRPVRPPGPRPD